METIDRHTRLPRKLSLLFGLPPAFALVVLAADMTWGGGGHPPLGAVLVSWAIYPTLTGYLSRAFLGSDFPSYFIMLLGLMEYPLVGFGLGSIIARAKAWTDHRIRVGVIAFLSYMSVQFASHILLNLQIVNLTLVFHTSPAVSEAAVDRIRESGDTASLPTLQQKAVEELESVERGEWKSAGGGKRERTRYARYAKATFRTDRRLNIRLSRKDLEAIQKRALAEGLPYQTLISSLLHKVRVGPSQGRLARRRARRLQ